MPVPMLGLLLLAMTGCITASTIHHPGMTIKVPDQGPDGAPDMSGLASGEVQACLRFLKEHMPKPDQHTVTFKALLSNTLLALAARNAHPWASAVPWELFLNDVLPYASLDEPRDAWRALFTPLFAPLVANATSLVEAAQILNKEIWGLWGIVFKSNQTPDIMSPTQVIEAGYASCTGLSIFLVDACRAVGIPARVAGTPNWAPQPESSAQPSATSPAPTWAPSWLPAWLRPGQLLRKLGIGKLPAPGLVSGGGDLVASVGDHVFNNHDWVEIWDGEAWSFVGAAEYDARGMNRTWFFPNPAKGQIPGSWDTAIYAASYAPSCGQTVFPLIWNFDYNFTYGCDVTQSYIDAAVLP